MNTKGILFYQERNARIRYVPVLRCYAISIFFFTPRLIYILNDGAGYFSIKEVYTAVIFHRLTFFPS